MNFYSAYQQFMDVSKELEKLYLMKNHANPIYIPRKHTKKKHI